MAMRSQIYEWANLAAAGQTSSIRRVTASDAVAIAADTDIDVFIGGFGNNITKPAETTATEFVVIEDVSCGPTLPCSTQSVLASGVAGQLNNWTSSVGIVGPRSFVQVRINTTDYFLDPDNVPNDGIPGAASPYPRTIDFQPSFNLYPDVYVLPGQVWDMLVTFYNVEGMLFGAAAGVAGATTAIDAGQMQAFCKYTLYDGPDALIANKLLEMGISINPGNVDWYKRSLLSA